LPLQGLTPSKALGSPLGSRAGHDARWFLFPRWILCRPIYSRWDFWLNSLFQVGLGTSSRCSIFCLCAPVVFACKPALLVFVGQSCSLLYFASSDFRSQAISFCVVNYCRMKLVLFLSYRIKKLDVF
jgi:hypothetical protein